MKNTFNRQLPPPKKLGIKSIRIHSIAGNSHKTGRFSKPLLCLMRQCHFPLWLKVWAKGMAATWKLRSFQRKSWYFSVCAPNRRTARWVSITHTIFSSVERMFDSFPPALKGLPRCGQQCGSDQPAERACGWRGCENHVWIECCESFSAVCTRKQLVLQHLYVPTYLFLGSAKRLWRCSFLLLVQHLLHWGQQVGFGSLSIFFELRKLPG